MTTTHQFSDDPRLSAYAFGELSADERTAFEHEIADCPEALAEVAEIEACARELTAALKAEPLPAGYSPKVIPASIPASNVLVAPNDASRRVSKRTKLLLTGMSSSALLLIGFFFYTLHGDEDSQREYYADGKKLADNRFSPSFRRPTDAPSLKPEERRMLESLGYASNGDGNLGGLGGVHSDESLESRQATTFGVGGEKSKPQAKAEAENEEWFEESIRPGVVSSTNGVANGNGATLNVTGGSYADENRPTTPTSEPRNLAASNRTRESKPEGARQEALKRYLDRTGAAGPTAGSPKLTRTEAEADKKPSALSLSAKEKPDTNFESTTELGESRGRYILSEVTDESKKQLDDRFGGERDEGWELGFGVRDKNHDDALRRAREAASNETYAPLVENDFLSPRKQPLSTFGLDVDTAAYANVRRFLQQGAMPPVDAVRIEELVNYFRYRDPQPTEHPLAVTVAHGACPWAPQHKLVRIGLVGKEIPKAERPISNLVFLIDVSGSMQDPNKLPLVQVALQMLAEELGEKDHISIVTYSNTAQLLLPPTSGQQRSEIMSAITRLKAEGSTNGAAGIQLAYDTAKLNLLKEGSNRVILCTDGDFNVGITDDDQLVTFLKENATAGIYLSIFGFGMGNLKDAKLEKLADRGNGQYGYIDSTHEARKVFVEELTSTLYTIAKDVKLQVEFNPSRVAEYRLIGYENRLMPAQDFNDDAKDSGDLGAGHSVVALYEIVPTGIVRQPPVVDDLKYQGVPKTDAPKEPDAAEPTNLSNEWLTVKVRYQSPQTLEGVKTESVKLEFPLKDEQEFQQLDPVQKADFGWSSAVAMYGLLLRNSNYRGAANYDAVLELATASKGEDPTGRQAEFLELVRRAKALSGQR
ncbi:MAG: von Willebrand factor type A domain-containing protein [Planctomycetaceae bacterium]